MVSVNVYIPVYVWEKAPVELIWVAIGFCDPAKVKAQCLEKSIRIQLSVRSGRRLCLVLVNNLKALKHLRVMKGARGSAFSQDCCKDSGLKIPLLAGRGGSRL